MDNYKIIFSSGGTGGHIFPTLSAIKYFCKKKYNVVLVTDPRGNKYLEDYKEFKSYILNTDTLFKKKFLKRLISLVKILFSITKACVILKKEKPDLIFGVGGYVSFPMCVASVIFRIPLVLYENNLILGKSNRYLLPFSNRLFAGNEKIINFPYKYKEKFHHIGHLLRDEILNLKKIEKKFNTKKITLLILGGSQGAEIFGKIIPETVKKLINDDYEIFLFQQCSSFQKKYLVDFYDKLKIKYEVFDFKEEISEVLINADLAISRCGASTSAELIEAQIPFIAIPYPFATDDHQFFNAKFYEEKGCCWILEQKNLNFDNLFDLIKLILKDRKILESKRNNMKKIDNKFALERVEKAIREIILNES